MKYRFTLLALLFSIKVIAQTVADESEHNNYRINFAIPDISAFKALDVDPSNILRPSSVKEVATNFSEFNRGGSFIIPKAFAIEVAPWLLFSENQTLSKYRDSGFTRFLYNTKISVASRGSDTENDYSSELAIGISFTLIGKEGDIKQGKFLQKFVKGKTDLILLRSTYLQEFLTVKGYSIAEMDDSKMPEFEEFLEAKGYTIEENKVNELIRNEIDSFKKNHWNENRLDFALAWKGSSVDSLVENTKSDNFNIWLTSSVKVGNWGQLLIGPNIQWLNLQTDSLRSVNVALPFRFYGGTNRLKAFSEFQFKYEEFDESHIWFFNLGTEFNPTDGIWLELFAGWEKEKDLDMLFVSRFNLRITIPENFKLF